MKTFILILLLSFNALATSLPSIPFIPSHLDIKDKLTVKLGFGVSTSKGLERKVEDRRGGDTTQRGSDLLYIAFRNKSRFSWGLELANFKTIRKLPGKSKKFDIYATTFFIEYSMPLIGQLKLYGNGGPSLFRHKETIREADNHVGYGGFKLGIGLSHRIFAGLKGFAEYDHYWLSSGNFSHNNGYVFSGIGYDF